MQQARTRRRRLVRWCAALLCLPGTHAFAQSPQMEALRRAAAYAEQMHPAGLAADVRAPQRALSGRLRRAPALQRALALANLHADDTLPFHLEGSFTLHSDLGRERTGTLAEDRYNDRWSRLTVTLDGVRSSQWVLEGRHMTDDRFAVVPFGLQRLLHAIFNPAGNLLPDKVPITTDTVTQDGVSLQCTVFGRQPPPDEGMLPASRSLCVDPATGDLRLDVTGFGFRIVYDGMEALGARRLATRVRVFEADSLVAELRLSLRVAGDLSPSSFAADVAQTAAEPPREAARFCFMGKPWQMNGNLETLDAHMVPLGEEALKRHAPVVVARVLTGTDGRLADLEVLGDTEGKLRAQALRVLQRSAFRRLEWHGQPVMLEGLLLLGAP